MKRHVALVGFMAAGKSTIGRKLARELGCEFFDTDAEVVRAHGPVATIFEREGEAAFRRYEREAVESLLRSDETGVIALGGGAPTVAANRAFLRRRAHTVFLNVSPEQVLHRVSRSREPRPVLGDRPTLARIRQLYEERLPYYACADHVVEARRLNAREILDDILRWLRKTAP